MSDCVASRTSSPTVSFSFAAACTYHAAREYGIVVTSALVNPRFSIVSSVLLYARLALPSLWLLELPCELFGGLGECWQAGINLLHQEEVQTVDVDVVRGVRLAPQPELADHLVSVETCLAPALEHRPQCACVGLPVRRQ